MKLPNSFNIKGVDYPIKFKWNLRNENGEACDGYVDRDKKIIFIDHSVKKTDRKRVFVHELLHCLMLEINISGNILTHETEEFLISNIEDFLFSKFNITLKK